MDNEQKIEALESAIQSGVRKIAVDGRVIEYRSLEEMQAALAALKRGGRTALFRQHRLVTGRGF